MPLPAPFWQHSTEKPTIMSATEKQREPKQHWRPGDRVRHGIWGGGAIVSLTDGSASVRFNDGETRRISVQYLQKPWPLPHPPANDNAPPAIDRKPSRVETDDFAALTFLDPTDWHGKPIPAREWYAADLVPLRQVTIVNGDGGVGKSLFTLQLAAAGAMRVDTMSMEPTPGRTLYVGAEDEADEFWRRLVDITAMHDRALSDLGDFRLLPLADRDALLSVPDRNGKMVPTQLMQTIEKFAGEWNPKLIVFDTAADLFGGDEIKRGQVRQFIAQLRQLAIGIDCAVVLLAHPSLDGMRSGSGSSGSTAWNNSVRSRLYLTRPEDKGADPDLRILKTMKTNYGKTGGELKIRWKDGAFVLDDGKPPVGSMLLAARADRVFIETLAKLFQQGQKLSPSPSATYAPKVIAAHPDGAGISKKELVAAQQRLLDANRVRIVEDGPASRRTRYLVVVEGQDSD
jgi:archaellum biogenesis ATPase FlaH